MGLESASNLFEALIFCQGANCRESQSKIPFTMKVVRLALLFATAGMALSASANPEILKIFKETYSKPTANCQECHTKPPQRNLFGKEVEAAIDKANASEVTAQIFKSIESSDADSDGVSNGDEIKGDSMPGDVNSKPVVAAPNAPAKEPSSSELVPKHTFHPAIIHFPIALLAIAALLELISKRKSDEIYHKASVINLAIGLISSAGAVITGVLAWQRLGYNLEGNLLIHLILASASVLLGIGAYIKREKGAYLWLIVATGVLVLVAGHFGGNMVYG